MFHVLKIACSRCGPHTARAEVQIAIAKVAALNNQLEGSAHRVLAPTRLDTFNSVELRLRENKKKNIVIKGRITNGSPKPRKGLFYLTDYPND